MCLGNFVCLFLLLPSGVGYERLGFYRLKPGITQLEYRLFRAISVDHDVLFVVQEHPINH